MKGLLYIGKVALLFIGGAIVLYSSGCTSTPMPKASSQNIMTEKSEDMVVIMSENGRPSYRFETSLIEGYTLAIEPYREFREGIKITTYQDDSLSMVDAILTSNYAIYYETSQLWEARGDVVAVKSDGRELYTQQLFWDSKSKMIYSNVDTKIVDTNNNDVFEGEGFESDETMNKWSFRKLKGRMTVDVSTSPEAEEAEAEAEDVAETEEAAKAEEVAKAAESTEAEEAAKAEEVKEAANGQVEPEIVEIEDVVESHDRLEVDGSDNIEEVDNE